MDAFVNQPGQAARLFGRGATGYAQRSPDGSVHPFAHGADGLGGVVDEQGDGAQVRGMEV